MNIEIPSQSLIAIGTIVAALITAVVTFVNLTMTKEQKTSDFRQAWIDSLREELSIFFSSVRTISKAHEAFYRTGDNYEKQNFPWSKEQIAEQRQKTLEMAYRIKLRLNPGEPEHKELFRLVDIALESPNQLSKNNPCSKNSIQSIENAFEYSRPLLKHEWERVKEGELAFRVARNWVSPIIVLICLVFIAVILMVDFN